MGALVALGAVALCVRELAKEWPQVSAAVRSATVWPLVAAVPVAIVAMAGLAVLWWACLHLFVSTVRVRDAVAWYFAGELGKYLPGGVWQVLGRGELARRGAGISRGDGYVTTLISYASMCIGAGFVCAGMAPLVAGYGASLRWGWLMIALVPFGIVLCHPRVMGPLFALLRRGTKGRVSLVPQPWARMMALSVAAAPTWLLVGASAVLVTHAFGFHQHMGQVAFAAVVAWIVGFLAVLVPAGAGVRELVFAGIAGLGTTNGIVVAAGVRVLYIFVDALCGVVGIWHSRRAAAGLPPADADSTSKASVVRA